MIVRRAADGLVLFRQTDHALLAACFADAWGNDRFDSPPQRDSALIAAARHDDGWARWELAPTLKPDGQPTDFLSMPVSEHVELYRRGVDLVEAEDAYAGLLASLHGKRLYTRPLQEGGPARYTYLEGADRDLAQGYVDHELSRQERLSVELSGRLGLDPAVLRQDTDETWRLLQVWDRLSIFICLQPLGEGTDIELPPVADRSGQDVRLRMRSPGPGEVTLDPYPFAENRHEFSIVCVKLPDQPFGGVGEYRRAFRQTARSLQSFCIRPGD